MSETKVSVLMPVYNMGETVENAILSVLNQKDVNFELIIVDDGSFDMTPTVLKKFRRHKNVKVSSQPNKGKNAAFNKAFYESNGDYLTFFAADDFMPEKSLYIRKQLLEKDQNPYSVSCGKILTFSTDRKFNNILIPRKNIPNLSGGAIMFQKQISTKIFPLPEFLPNEDTWARLVINKYASEIKVSSEIVLQYRVHEGNSIRKDEIFEIFSKRLHERTKAYEVFKEKFDKELSTEEKHILEEKIELEKIRYEGDWKKILAFKNCSMREKIRNLVYSNKFLYKQKINLYRYFTGWMA